MSGRFERALQTGGLPGVRQLDQVLASIARPYSGYYRRVENKAAALFQSLAMGHGFTDGNKRTAFILTNVLLEKSGYRLDPKEPSEALDTAIEALAVSVVTRELCFDDIVAWFKARIARRLVDRLVRNRDDNSPASDPGRGGR